MPFFEDDEDQIDQPMVGGAVPSAPGSGAKQQAPAQSGRFIGLSEYMGLNQPQAAKMAHDIGNNVNESAAMAQRDVNMVGHNFNQAIGSFAPQDPNAKYSTSQQAKDAENKAKEASSGLSDSKYNSASTWNNDAYMKAQEAAQKADDKLGATKNGMSALVEDQYGTGGHSSGELDWASALAGNAGAQRFTDLRQRFGNISKALAGVEADSARRSGLARDQANAAAMNAGGQIAGLQAQEKAKQDALNAARNLENRKRQILDLAKQLGYQGNDPVAARGFIINVQRSGNKVNTGSLDLSPW